MDVNDALYHACHDYEGGVPSLAPRMDLAVSTLYSMANKNADNHGWSLKRFRELLHFTKDARPLEALCTENGGLFVKLPELKGRALDDVYRDLARLAKEFGDVPREVIADLKDGRLSPKNFERIKRAVMEMQQAGAELLQDLADVVDKPPHKK